MPSVVHQEPKRALGDEELERFLAERAAKKEAAACRGSVLRVSIEALHPTSLQSRRDAITCSRVRQPPVAMNKFLSPVRDDTKDLRR